MQAKGHSILGKNQNIAVESRLTLALAIVVNRREWSGLYNWFATFAKYSYWGLAQLVKVCESRALHIITVTPNW